MKTESRHLIDMPQLTFLHCAWATREAGGLDDEQEFELLQAIYSIAAMIRAKHPRKPAGLPSKEVGWTAPEVHEGLSGDDSDSGDWTSASSVESRNPDQAA